MAKTFHLKIKMVIAIPLEKIEIKIKIKTKIKTKSKLKRLYSQIKNSISFRADAINISTTDKWD